MERFKCIFVYTSTNTFVRNIHKQAICISYSTVSEFEEKNISSRGINFTDMRMHILFFCGDY